MLKNIIQIIVTLGFIGFFIYRNFFAFGSKVNFGGGEEVYYKSGATEGEAQKVGETLKAIQFFDGVGNASVQVVKRDADYVVRFVTIDSAWTNPDNHKTFSRIGWELSQKALGGKNVVVELCDDSFDTQATVAMEESRIDDAKVVNISPLESVYYRGEATEAEAKSVGQALQTLQFFDNSSEKAVQLDRAGEEYIIRFVTHESAWTDKELHEAFAELSWSISQDVLSGKNTTAELCDSFLETKATIGMKEPALEVK